MSEQVTFQGVEYTLPAPGGLIFESQAAAYQLLVRDLTPIWDHGIRIGEMKELTADFGDMDVAPFHDVDGDYEGNPGSADYYAIRGHYCHTLEQARRKGWTDEERAIVEKKLLAFQTPNTHWLKTKTPAQKPWPTYDETPFDKVAELAQTLGLVAEAAAYEAENKARKTVLAALASTPEPVAEIEAVEA